MVCADASVILRVLLQTANIARTAMTGVSWHPSRPYP
jgi:hypothetical protein